MASNKLSVKSKWIIEHAKYNKFSSLFVWKAFSWSSNLHLNWISLLRKTDFEFVYLFFLSFFFFLLLLYSQSIIYNTHQQIKMKSWNHFSSKILNENVNIQNYIETCRTFMLEMLQYIMYCIQNLFVKNCNWNWIIWLIVSVAYYGHIVNL